MTISRRYWTLAVVLGLCVLATAGCRRRRSGSTTIIGSSIFTTDNFPGGAVQDGNVGDDQRAMSNAGVDVNDVRVFFNGNRDIAMVVYDEIEGGGFSDQESALYVQYYDGGFRPPVVLGSAVDLVRTGDWDSFFGDTLPALSDVTVAWVNTENHDSDLARDRDGDAILTWRGRDYDSGGSDGPNTCLYSTYFDVSYADSPGARYGFQEFATRLNTEDESDENVRTHGLISDGLCGEARWGYYGLGDGQNNYRWGDDTTQIVVFWNQVYYTGAGTDIETLWVRFPLDQAGPAEAPLVPTVPDKVDILTFGSSDSGVDAYETQVYTEYVTYNGTIWQRVAADATGSPGLSQFSGTVDSQTDQTIQASTFNLAGSDFFTTINMQTVTPDATDTDENGADFIMQAGDFMGGHSVYGPDEGLLEIVFVSTELAEEPTGDYFANALNNGRLVLNRIDPTDGTSEGQALLDLEQSLISDPVDPRMVDLQISRNGDYVVIAWGEIEDNGGSDDTALWTTVYTTSRDSDVGILALGSSVTGTVAKVNPDVDGDPVNWFMFQNHLGYVCGRQSTADRMNLFYEQSDGSYDQVDRVLVEVDMSTAPASFTTTRSVLQADDDDGVLYAYTFVNVDRPTFDGTDAGHDGEVIAVYFEDIDTVNGDVQLMATETGTGGSTLEIDSNDLFRSPSGFFLVSTPAGDDIGTFGADDADQRDHGAEIVHVVFTESEINENLASGFDAIRTRAFYTDNPGSGTFAEHFAPNPLTDDPFQLSLDSGTGNGSSSPFVEDVTQSGNGVGLYFVQFGHYYYQEFDDNANGGDVAWRTDGDNDFPYTDPALIDDDCADEIDQQWVFTRGCTCDTLDGAMILWLKTLEENNANRRLQGRIRDDNN